MPVLSYIKIIRLNNAIMATGAVFLGSWISSAQLSLTQITLLAGAAFCSTGFGNIINDLIDIQSDRINHPNRPLPQGDISPRGALIYCFILAVTALIIASYVAPLYGIATLLPLILLTLYAKFFKGTPLFGNGLVSLLVAYAIIFGSLKAPNLPHLYIPAVLAMLLNFSREIIKDIQDNVGDRITNVTTSATLPYILLKRLLYLFIVINALLLFLPYFIGYTGIFYTGIILVIAVPLHIRCFMLLKRTDWEKQCSHLSSLYKLEMFTGLIALAVDHFLNN